MLRSSASIGAEGNNVQSFLYHQTIHWWSIKGEQELKQIDDFIQQRLKLPGAETPLGGPRWGAGLKYKTNDYKNSCAIDTLLFLSLWWWDDSKNGQGLKQRVHVRNTPAKIMVGHFQDCLLKLSRKATGTLSRVLLNQLMNDLKHCFWGLLAAESKIKSLGPDVKVPYLSNEDIEELKKKKIEELKNNPRGNTVSNNVRTTKTTQNGTTILEISSGDDDGVITISSGEEDSAENEIEQPIVIKANYMSFSNLAIPFLKPFGEIRVDYTWACSKKSLCNNQRNTGSVYYSHLKLLPADLGEDIRLSPILSRKLQSRSPWTQAISSPRTDQPCTHCGYSTQKRDGTKRSDFKYAFGQQCIIDLDQIQTNKAIVLDKTITIKDDAYDLSEFVLLADGHYTAYRRLRPYRTGKWIKYDGMRLPPTNGFTRVLSGLNLKQQLQTVEFVRYVRRR